MGEHMMPTKAFCRYAVLLLVMLYVAPLYAADTAYKIPTATEMLSNISDQIPSLMRLVTAFAYVAGIWLLFLGIMKLKHLGEMRTQMSQEHSFGEPMAMIVVGALLLYLPTTVEIGMSTFWQDPNPMGYATESLDQWASVLRNIFMVVQLFGTIALVKGLLMLSHVGGRGGHQGGFAKGMLHVIGGIFCINIYQFVQMVLVTIGVHS
jgi:intracellular multiplication protein IcmC